MQQITKSQKKKKRGFKKLDGPIDIDEIDCKKKI